MRVTPIRPPLGARTRIAVLLLASPYPVAIGSFHAAIGSFHVAIGSSHTELLPER
jgi:hypothetical protein